MYAKPRLVRFGTFRELTLFGIGDDGDGVVIGRLDVDACWFGSCDSRKRS